MGGKNILTQERAGAKAREHCRHHRPARGWVGTGRLRERVGDEARQGADGQEWIQVAVWAQHTC